MIKLPLYNQNDGRWKSKLIGTSGWTIGEQGCTVSALAMLLKNFGIDETPATVVEKLNVVGGINPIGEILWSAIPKIWPVHFHWRQYTTLELPQLTYRQNTDAALERIKRLLALGQPVLLNVDNVGNDKRPDHWVVAYGTRIEELLIHDPDGGKEIDFSSKYGDPLMGIYGYTVLIGSPQAFDDGADPDILDELVHKAGIGLWKAAQIQDGKDVKVYAKELIDTLI